MPYPFTSWPGLDTFVRRAKEEFGATERTVEGVVGPRGPTVMRILDRDGKSAVLPEPDGYALTPSTVRSLCRRLGIPVEAFGFTLGDWDDETDPN